MVAVIVGVATIAGWLEGVAHPPPPPGLICWEVTRRTAAETQRGSRCEPAEGWHLEDWPG
jgi:hypothetical protein